MAGPRDRPKAGPRTGGACPRRRPGAGHPRLPSRSKKARNFSHRCTPMNADVPCAHRPWAKRRIARRDLPKSSKWRRARAAVRSELPQRGTAAAAAAAPEPPLWVESGPSLRAAMTDGGCRLPRSAEASHRARPLGRPGGAAVSSVSGIDRPSGLDLHQCVSRKARQSPVARELPDGGEDDSALRRSGRVPAHRRAPVWIALNIVNRVVRSLFVRRFA